MKHKKQRGQKRKLKALLDNINQFSPFQETTDKYEKFLVPSDRFISSPKTYGKVKTAFCKAWLKKTAEIMEQKPEDLPFCKVVAVINAFDLWESQIIIFYDKDYYDCFWLRDSIEQTWKPIDEQRGLSFHKAHHIKTNLKEKGYFETIVDSDFIKKGILWFYGDI